MINAGFGRYILSAAEPAQLMVREAGRIVPDSREPARNIRNWFHG